MLFEDVYKRQVFFRSFPMEWTWNYEKQQNLGYTYAMIPISEKLYKDKPEEKAAALQRHLEFFNTTPHMVTLIPVSYTHLTLRQVQNKKQRFHCMFSSQQSLLLQETHS